MTQLSDFFTDSTEEGTSGLFKSSTCDFGTKLASAVVAVQSDSRLLLTGSKGKYMRKRFVAWLSALGMIAVTNAANAEIIYSWTIEKTADASELVLTAGQLFLVNFQVRVSAASEGSTGDAIDECINVSDTSVGVLGTVCANEAPKAFDYSLSFGTGIEADVELEFGANSFSNVASFVTNDRVITGSAQATVRATVGSPIPEPGTLALLGLGLAGLAATRRRMQ